MDNETIDIEEPMEKEDEQEVQIKKIRRPLSEEQLLRKRESMKRANEVRIKKQKEAKEAVKTLIDMKEKAMEIMIEPKPEAITENPLKSRIHRTVKLKPESNMKDLSQDDIKEYIRYKKQEEDNLKKLYLLKQQKENEERYMKAYSSLFNI